MSYKLDIEKRHRKSRGGDRPRQIEKGVAWGRILGLRKTAVKNQHGRKSGAERYTTLHATRGFRTKNLATL